MKVCIDCQIPKPLSDFYTVRRRGRRPILYAHCKPCHRRRNAASEAVSATTLVKRRRYKAEHRAEQQAYDRERRSTDEFRSEANASRRDKRQADPAPIRLADRRRQATRRARKRAVAVEAVDPVAVWVRDQGICGLCGEAADPADWHLDHVIPLAAGGEHSYANVQVSHPRCNLVKGARAA